MKQAPPARGRAAVAIAAALAAALPGCAVSFPTDDGGRRVVGLVDMTVPASDTETAGETVAIRGLGLSLHSLRAGGALTLGWSEVRIATLRDDAAVLGAALLE